MCTARLLTRRWGWFLDSTRFIEFPFLTPLPLFMAPPATFTNPPLHGTTFTDPPFTAPPFMVPSPPSPPPDCTNPYPHPEPRPQPREQNESQTDVKHYLNNLETVVNQIMMPLLTILLHSQL